MCVCMYVCVCVTLALHELLNRLLYEIQVIRRSTLGHVRVFMHVCACVYIHGVYVCICVCVVYICMKGV